MFTTEDNSGININVLNSKVTFDFKTKQMDQVNIDHVLQTGI